MFGVRLWWCVEYLGIIKRIYVAFNSYNSLHCYMCDSTKCVDVCVCVASVCQLEAAVSSYPTREYTQTQPMTLHAMGNILNLWVARKRPSDMNALTIHTRTHELQHTPSLFPLTIHITFDVIAHKNICVAWLWYNIHLEIANLYHRPNHMWRYPLHDNSTPLFVCVHVSM